MSSHKPSITGAAIWDMDGVLVDSAEFHFSTWRTVIRQLYKIEIERSLFDKVFGMSNKKTLREFLGKEPSTPEGERVIDLKEQLFRRLISGREHLSPMTGVVPLLERLMDLGWVQAVASSAPRANIDLSLEKMKIRHWFSVIVSDDQVENGKPEPDIFEKVALKTGIPPRCCVVIEDSPAGIEAARRAGMHCVAVATTRPKTALGMADLVFDNLDQVRIEDLSRLIG